MSGFVVRDARIDEVDELTSLCIRATEDEGYDAGFIARALPALAADVRLINGKCVLVVEDAQSEVVGVVAVRPSGYAGLILLERLFVDPSSKRKGVGRTLFEAAIERATKMAGCALLIYANPTVAGFYERQGGIRIGEASFVFSPEVSLPIFIRPFQPACSTPITAGAR
ncbi:GNAT family N-acetyltransferase [Bradyrhizobium sp. STM 3557]|uniref:GNAT family N-acetyltransferase n=1 Tax=Bradyrhizobium sp. STM 3557 TaxID=578920 RepID=UPI00388FE0A6